MGFGMSIFLIAVGAILAFAAEFQLSWLDVRVAGWVLMLVGVLGLGIALMMWYRRRSTVP